MYMLSKKEKSEWIIPNIQTKSKMELAVVAQSALYDTRLFENLWICLNFQNSEAVLFDR